MNDRTLEHVLVTMRVLQITEHDAGAVGAYRF